MNLLQLTIKLSKEGHSVEYITAVLRRRMKDQGKTDAEIAILLGELE